MSTPVRGRMPRLLLASLALAHPQPVADQRLVELLWDDEAPNSFDSALRVHCSSLRKQLASTGMAVNRVREQGYVLTGDIAIDAVLMQERWNQTQVVTDAEMRLGALEQILQMWKGDSVADLRRSTYGDRVAAMLDSRHHEIRLAYCDAAIEAGRSRLVVNDLLSLERRDPLDTNTVCLLARALYQEGRHDRGLRVLASHRQKLAEVGLEPSPNVGDLESQLLRHDVSAPDAGTASDPRWSLPRSIAGVAPPELFGRADVFQTLTEQLERTRADSTVRLVCLRGPAGVGKSAVLATFGREAATSGARVLHGWGIAPRSIPLGTLVPVVEQLIDATDLAWPPTLSELTTDNNRVSTEHPLSADLAAGLMGRRALVREIADLLDATDSTQPTVLLLDDYHQVDELSDATIRSLLREPPDRPLLIVLGERTPSLLGDCTIELQPLRPDELAEWIGASGTSADIEQVHADTGGLPLLVKLLGDAGWTEVPPSGQGVFLADRFSLLDRRARFVLEWAAIVGLQVSVEHLAAVLQGQSALEILESLDEASQLGPHQLRQRRAGHQLLTCVGQR